MLFSLWEEVVMEWLVMVIIDYSFLGEGLMIVLLRNLMTYGLSIFRPWLSFKFYQTKELKLISMS